MGKCLFITATFLLYKYKAANIEHYYKLKNVNNKYKY